MAQSRWALVVVILAVLALVAVVIVPKHVGTVVDKVADAIGRATMSIFKIHSTTVTIYAGAIRELKKTPKLVVCTAVIDAEVNMTNVKEILVAGFPIPLGTTTVRVKASDNKVQFFIPLASLQEGEAGARFKEEWRLGKLHKITVTLPGPRLDGEMVEVQSDPAKIDVEINAGGVRLKSCSGAVLRDEAMRDLRGAVIVQGRHQILTESVRNKGQEVATETLGKLLKPALDAANGDYKDVIIEVQFDK